MARSAKNIKRFLSRVRRLETVTQDTPRQQAGHLRKAFRCGHQVGVKWVRHHVPQLSGVAGRGRECPCLTGYIPEEGWKCRGATPGESRNRGQPSLAERGNSGFSKLWTETVDELAKVHSFQRKRRRTPHFGGQNPLWRRDLVHSFRGGETRRNRRSVAQKRRFPSSRWGSGKPERDSSIPTAWWRRRESNPGPKSSPRRLLRAFPAFSLSRPHKPTGGPRGR